MQHEAFEEKAHSSGVTLYRFWRHWLSENVLIRLYSDERKKKNTGKLYAIHNKTERLNRTYQDYAEIRGTGPLCLISFHPLIEIYTIQSRHRFQQLSGTGTLAVLELEPSRPHQNLLSSHWLNTNLLTFKPSVVKEQIK